MNAIGTAVTGGMLSATFIDLIFIPLFYVLVARMFEGRKPQGTLEPIHGSTETQGGSSL